MEACRLHLVRALSEMGWTDCSQNECLSAWQSNVQDCLLKTIDSKNLLSIDGKQHYEELRGLGMELRGCWPRKWHASLRCWTGERLFFSYAGNFAASKKFSTLACSAMGRHGQRLPEWPRLVDLVLQSIVRAEETLLVVPETTTCDITTLFAQQAAVDIVRVEPSKPKPLVDWLREVWRELTASDPQLRQRIFVSPASAGEAASVGGPQQDRLAIGLADHVYAIAIRPNGNISRLLRSRLAEGSFPAASVLIALPERYQKKRDVRGQGDWLDRGAVGWYVPPHLLDASSNLVDCRCRDRADSPDSLSREHSIRATQQLCSPVPRWWRHLSANEALDELNDWRWLVHCTRGSVGPAPEESPAHYWQQAWMDGRLSTPHPLITLDRILRQRMLKGNSHITRTAQRCVSFSEVPLISLLDRRQFRSHLNRWDWEPYGILFCREALRQLGAQRVTYGDESSFADLPSEKHAFFQPRGKDLSGWSEEREWRLLGDLEFRHLPPGSLTIFVRTQTEARQLSRRCPWPVLWTS